MNISLDHPTVPTKIPLFQRNWPKAMLLLCFVIFAVIVIGGKIFLASDVVPHKGKISLKGLSAPVKVKWDRWGVPHIEAENEEDLFLTYGWVVASERLFQMDLQRRVARGELAEIFGAKALPVDKFFRTLRLGAWAHEFFVKNEASLNPKMMKLMDQFISGVNQFVQNGPRPLEMILLSYTPKNFTKEDTLAYGGVMGFQFAEAHKSDPLLSYLQNSHKENVWKDLWPVASPKEEENLVSNSWDNKKNIEINLVKNLSLIIKPDLISPWIPFEGSNAWVLSGKRSKSGKPLLASDPHIQFSQPGVWFEAHLMAPGFEIYGHHIALIPFAILGHNHRHGWGVTMSEVDDMDFYIEKIQPEDQSKVLYEKEWIAVKQWGDKIKVKNEADVIFPIRASTHGPFIDHLLSPQLQLPEGQHLSMYWPYLSLDNFMLETFYELPRVQNVNQLPSILAKATGPGLNILYADSEDHIAWYVLGKILKRQNHVNPLALLDGSQKSNDPLGFYSFEHNPFSVDPESGVIVSANHYPYTKNIKTPKLWGMWQGPERYERIGELLNTKEKWDLEELKNVQTDEVLADGPNILAKLLPRLEKNLKLDDKDKTIIELLKNWKGENKSKLAAPLIFWQWMYFLSAEVFADELGVNLSTYQDLPVSWAAIKQLIDKEESPVWDNMKTEERETMDVDISQSYKKMKEKLSLLGSNPSSWRWGFKHKLTFLHPLGREKTLAWLFNVGPYEVGGGNFEVSHMKFFRSKDDFSVFHGPSTRRLIDFSHPEESWGILPSGNSGHLMSAHYMDQAKDFIIGKYRPMLLDGEKIDAYKEGEVVFAP